MLLRQSMLNRRDWCLSLARFKKFCAKCFSYSYMYYRSPVFSKFCLWAKLEKARFIALNSDVLRRNMWCRNAGGRKYIKFFTCRSRIFRPRLVKRGRAHIYYNRWYLLQYILRLAGLSLELKKSSRRRRHDALRTFLGRQVARIRGLKRDFYSAELSLFLSWWNISVEELLVQCARNDRNSNGE